MFGGEKKKYSDTLWPSLLLVLYTRLVPEEGESNFNPYLTNGFSHYYHLGESTFIIRGVRSDF